VDSQADRGLRRWFTPPEIARARGLRTGKVLEWIKSGELEAVNHASDRRGSPRWRVSIESLAAFDAARSNRARTTASVPRRSTRKRASDSGDRVIEFFK
jgi:hypothetical protein